jgi:hypothetical protein
MAVIRVRMWVCSTTSVSVSLDRGTGVKLGHNPSTAISSRTTHIYCRVLQQEAS